MRLYQSIFKITNALVFSFVFVSGCKDIERPPVWMLLLAPGLNTGSAGVVSSDFGSTGRFTVIDRNLVASPNYRSIHSDSVAYFQQNLVYIVNRLNSDSILVLDPALGYNTVAEYSTGAGSNPQAIQVNSDQSAFITLYNRNYLLQVNAATGIQEKTIDLSQYSESTANPDGYPEASGLYLYENRLYGSVQRLDRNSSSGYYPPADNSFLLEIDSQTGVVLNRYTFPFPNPFGKIRMVRFDGTDHLIFALPGKMGFLSELDGGISAFNLATRSFRPSPFYTEATAGGDILEAVIKDRYTGYAYVLDADFNKSIQKFNPSTGEKISHIVDYPASGGVVSGMMLTPDGRLFVSDAGFENPGVSVYDTNAGDRKLTALPIDTGLRPSDLIYME